MCDEEAIELTEGSVNHETYKPGEEFTVLLKVNLQSVVVFRFPFHRRLDQSVGGSSIAMCHRAC